MILTNPFLKLKIEYILFLLLPTYFIVFLCCAITISLFNFGFSYKDPIREYIVYTVYCFVVCWFLLQKLNQLQINVKNIVGKLSINYQWLIKLFGLVAIQCCFALGIGILTFSFLSIAVPSFIESLLTDASKTDSQLSSVPIYYNALKLITSVLIAPVAEEFVFRGVLLHVCAARWHIHTAIILSSLAFGFFHFNPIGVSIAGILLALIYIKTRSLIVSIVAHSMNNIIAIALPFFFAKIINNYNDIPTLGEVTDMWKIGGILIVVSAPFVFRFIHRQWSNNISLPYFTNVRYLADVQR
ncbi:MAG: CPBP family intramembrane glutamic endopeptidase [Cyanobacteria bacterium P01_A01_bin.83]